MSKQQEKQSEFINHRTQDTNTTKAANKAISKPSIRLIVAGSRLISDYKALSKELDQISNKYHIQTIISGHASGIDQLGERYAREHKIPLEVYPANWTKYGKSAGYKRNELMATKATACLIIRYSDSKGSKHMSDLAKKYKLRLRDIVITRKEVK